MHVLCVLYQAAAAYSSLYFFFHFFFLSNFHTLIFFVTLFSGTVMPRRLKLGTHMDNGWMYRVYHIRLLLLIHPFIFSFFFLSNFQTLKFFITLFSGAVRPRRLKLGTHVDNRWMYHVYRNQAAAAAAYLSLYFFIFLSLQLSNIENFHTFGQWVDVSCIQVRLLLLICPFISSFFFCSNFQKLKIFCHTFHRNYEV